MINLKSRTMINLKLTLSRGILENAIITALEGGSNYWYFLSDEALSIVKKSVEDYLDISLSIAICKAFLDKGVEIPIHDYESTEELIGSLDPSLLEQRMQALLDDEGYRWALLAEMREEGDATSSDIVFQYMVLGEVTYG